MIHGTGTTGSVRRGDGWWRFPAAVRLLCGGLLLVVFGGCGTSNIKRTLHRGNRSDQDLLALVPTGMDAVLDVAVTGPSGLAQLGAVDELLALVPTEFMQPLTQIVDQPLHQLEAAAVGFAKLGTEAPQGVVLLRGDVTRERVFHLVQKGGAWREVEYHGLALVETLAEKGGTPGTSSGTESPHGGGQGVSYAAAMEAAAMLTTRSCVLGTRLAVRQTIDIFRGEEDGVRTQADLMAALGRAPRAKTGRPAVLLATLITPALRGQVVATGLETGLLQASWISTAVAVGDGIDVGLVVGYRTLAAAQHATARLLAGTQDLQRRPVLRFLGLTTYLDPVQAVAVPAAAARPDPELHVAYRLPNDEVTALASRLPKLLMLLGKGAAAAPAN